MSLLKEQLEEAYKNLPILPTKEFFKEFALFKIYGRCLHTSNPDRKSTLSKIESELQELNLKFRVPINLAPNNWPANDEEDLKKLWIFLKSVKFSRRQIAIMLMVSSDSAIEMDTVYAHLMEATEKKSLRIKRKKKDGSYNKDHKEEKDIFTRRILNYCREKGIVIDTILDLYANDGNLSFYRDFKRHEGLINQDYFVVTNDLKEPNNDFQEDAGVLTKDFRRGRYKFALVDADAFGDPGTNINILDLINITDNVLILTFCEAPRFAYRNKTVLHNWGWNLFREHPKFGSFIERTIFQVERLGKLYYKKITYIDHYAWRGNSGFRIAFKVEDMK